MKVLTALFALLFSLLAQAQLTLVPATSDIEARPGEVKKVKVVADDAATKERVDPRELQRIGDTDTFLFSSLRDWKLENSKWVLDATIVFTKTDVTTAPLSFGFVTGPLEVRFVGWKWVAEPNQVAEAFSYEDVPLFTRSWWVKNWPVTLGALACIVLAAFRGSRSWRLQRKKKREQRTLLAQMAREISSASTLAELSELWLKRDTYRSAFQAEVLELEDFFKALNQIQFNPQVAPADLGPVLALKTKLSQKLGEAKNGV